MLGTEGPQSCLKIDDSSALVKETQNWVREQG